MPMTYPDDGNTLGSWHLSLLLNLKCNVSKIPECNCDRLGPCSLKALRNASPRIAALSCGLQSNTGLGAIVNRYHKASTCVKVAHYNDQRKLLISQPKVQ